jgi:hypothetical protein
MLEAALESGLTECAHSGIASVVGKSLEEGVREG